jgi:hypothetical protein
MVEMARFFLQFTQNESWQHSHRHVRMLETGADRAGEG